MTLNVLSDDLYDGNIQPTVVTGFSTGESYQMRSAQLASQNIDPTVVKDWFYIDEDTGTLLISVSSGVLNNDTDADGDNLTVTGIGSASHGNAVLVSATEIQYTPDPNFAGIDTVSYTVSDGNGGTASGTLNFSVTDIADPVGAVTDSDSGTNTVNESDPATTTVGITAVAVDPDPTNNGITYSLSIDAGGRFTIDSSTGVVTIADPSLIDYETNTSHMIEVTATSDDGSSNSASFIIGVEDEPPGPLLEFRDQQENIREGGLVQLSDGNFLLVGQSGEWGGDSSSLFVTKITGGGEIDQSFGDSGTAEFWSIWLCYLGLELRHYIWEGIPGWWLRFPDK